MNYKNLVKTSDAYSQGSIVTIGPILNGYEAEEFGEGDGDAGARLFVDGYADWGTAELETQNIPNRKYVDTVGDIDIFYDYGADYYFFSPNDMGAGDYVKDSLDSFNDVASFSDILEENGYGYSDFMDVRSKDGRTGTRYRLEADRGANPSGLEEALKAAYGEDKVIFSTGVNRYAPEQKIKSVIILDSHKVKDSFSDIDFFITEDNVYDLIHEGTTSVAIPSGADTKAFVAAVEDIIKDVAKGCGYKGLKLSTEIVGNMLNIFNNK